MDQKAVKTKEWVQKFVVALNLCPFAKLPFDNNALGYYTSIHKDPRLILEDFYKVIVQFEATQPKILSNGFLILNEEFDFDFTLDIQSIIEVFLEEATLKNEYQTVVFHPEFCFEGEEENAPGNFVNRSPFPMIHILRTEEMNRAVDFYPNIDEIPYRNAELLKKIKLSTIEEIFSEDFPERISKAKTTL